MKARIIVACIFVPILFVIMFFLPPEATAALVALSSAVGVYELLRPLKESIGNAVIIISVITAPAVCARRYFGTALANKLMFAWVLLFVIAVFCVLMFSKREEKPGYPDIAAALFGAFGGTAAMWLFRHKTKHWYFAVFFPLMAVVQTAVVAYAIVRLN